MAFTTTALTSTGSLIAGGAVGIMTVLGVVNSLTSDPAKSPVDITDVSVPYGESSVSGTTTG